MCVEEVVVVVVAVVVVVDASRSRRGAKYQTKTDF